MTLTLPELQTGTQALAGPLDLTPEQVRVLLLPIAGNRVQHLKGNAHLEAWDVRRWLNRIFGFGGWTLDTTELAVVREIELPTTDPKRSRWTVIYRAQARLTVRTADGRTIATYEDAAMGDSQNQPQLGQAHDQAMKTALSQALKRCAVNLGDQFGLSLYNDGSTEPVVVRTVPLIAGAVADPATPTLPEDAPVKPEPGTAPENERPPAAPVQQTPPDVVAAGVADVPAESLTPRGRDYLHEAHAAPDAATVRQIWADARAEGAQPEYLEQIAEVGKGKAAAEKRAVAQQPSGTLPGAPVSPQARLDALAGLYAAGEAAGLSPDETRRVLAEHCGRALPDATAQDIAACTADLTRAGGAR